MSWDSVATFTVVIVVPNMADRLTTTHLGSPHTRLVVPFVAGVLKQFESSALVTFDPNTLTIPASHNNNK